MSKLRYLKEIKILEDFKLPDPVLPKDCVLLKVDELDKEPKIIRKRTSEIRTLHIEEKGK